VIWNNPEPAIKSNPHESFQQSLRGKKRRSRGKTRDWASGAGGEKGCADRQSYLSMFIELIRVFNEGGKGQSRATGRQKRGGSMPCSNRQEFGDCRDVSAKKENDPDNRRYKGKKKNRYWAYDNCRPGRYATTKENGEGTLKGGPRGGCGVDQSSERGGKTGGVRGEAGKRKIDKNT